MEREWTTIDKSEWPERGEWDREPDKVQWRDAATGLPCLANRNQHSGNWCGYVGVYPGHPWHGVGYSACTQTPPCAESDCAHGPDNRVDVHGGLTFSDRCSPGETEATGICHVAEPGEAEPWWFGFDCAHSGDLSPGFPMRMRFYDADSYKPLDYVRRQCAALARQLATP